MRLDWGDQFPGSIPFVRNPLTGVQDSLQVTGEKDVSSKPITINGIFDYPYKQSTSERLPGSYYGWVLPPQDDTIISEADGTITEITANSVTITDGDSEVEQYIPDGYDISVSVSQVVSEGDELAVLDSTADLDLYPIISSEDEAPYYYVTALLEKGNQERVRLPAGTKIAAYDPIIAFPSSDGSWWGFVCSEELERYQLLEDLYPCSSALANRGVIGAPLGDEEPICRFEPVEQVTLYDVLGVVESSALATNGYIPAGYFAFGKKWKDTKFHEPLTFGKCSCDEEASPEPSPSPVEESPSPSPVEESPSPSPVEESPEPSPSPSPEESPACFSLGDLPEMTRDLIHNEDFVVVIDANDCAWKKRWFDCDQEDSPSPSPGA